MKNLMMMFLACASLFVAGCQKNEFGMTPDVETTAIDNTLSAALRYSASEDSVTLSKCKGKLTEIAVTDLSAAISTYISTTYPDATVAFAAKDAEGRVIVAIKLSDGTAKGLLFNADGTFKEEMLHINKKAKITKVEISALPSAITNYISTNYSSAETKRAGKNEAGEYFVEILVDNNIKILLFNANGSFNKELARPLFQPGKPGRGKGK